MPNAKQTFSALILAALYMLLRADPGTADSTSPRLAAYYDLKMLLCGQTAYQLRGWVDPQIVATGIAQVGVGKSDNYVLTLDGRLLTLKGKTRQLLDDVAWFSAGHSGIFAARTDGTLVYLSSQDSDSAIAQEKAKPIAASVIAASNALSSTSSAYSINCRAPDRISSVNGSTENPFGSGKAVMLSFFMWHILFSTENYGA